MTDFVDLSWLDKHFKNFEIERCPIQATPNDLQECYLTSSNFLKDLLSNPLLG